MRSTLLAASVAVLCLANPALAKTTHHTTTHHKHHYAHHRHHNYSHHRHRVHRSTHRSSHTTASVSEGPIGMGFDVANGVVHGGSELISVAMSNLGGNPTGMSHKWCAAALNVWLRRTGHRGSGSNTAISFAHYGHPTGARVGAIAVMPHHVGIVKAVGPGYVTLVSGNHGHRVGVGNYRTSRIIAFRQA